MANPTIKDSILIHHNVGEALRLLKKRMTDLSLTEYMSEVEEIDNDYRIMCGCLAHNMRDPQGEIVYNHLLRRTFRLYSNVRLASLRSVCLLSDVLMLQSVLMRVTSRLASR